MVKNIVGQFYPNTPSKRSCLSTKNFIGPSSISWKNKIVNSTNKRFAMITLLFLFILYSQFKPSLLLRVLCHINLLLISFHSLQPISCIIVWPWRIPQRIVMRCSFLEVEHLYILSKIMVIAVAKHHDQQSSSFLLS